MKLTIKPLKGETFEVDYEPDTKVKDLKETIASAKPEMPAAQQKLIYSGKILTDDSPMSEYGIKEGEFVVVMVQKAKGASPADAAPAPAAAAPAPTPSEPAAPVSGGDAQQIAASAMPVNAAGMESSIEQLCGMGFEREQVERCLRAAFGNPDRAVEYLMSGIPEGLMAGDSAPPPSSGGAPGGAPPPASPPGGGGGGAGGGAAPNAFPALPTGGGGGGGGEPLPPELAALRNSPQFAQLAQLVATNPEMLAQVLPALAASNPEAAQAIRENPEAFMRMLQQSASGGADPDDPVATMLAAVQAGGGGGGGMPPGMGGGMPGGGGGGRPQVVQLTEAEGQAVQRLCELGFDRQAAAQAYLACDRNEELAANFLFESGMND